MLVKQAVKELQLEIDRHVKGNGTVGDAAQLRSFTRHLEEILDALENDNITAKTMRKLGMGRAIVDSWPLDSKLGTGCPYAIVFKKALQKEVIENELRLPASVKYWESRDPHYPKEAGYFSDVSRHAIAGPIDGE